ncbi:MAG: LysR substrate-binding domain-containing protein [Actinomycetota bacterium]|nr:LysR substrate-binding domain-containing protein [Actinomycetota bacterium]
MRSFLVLAEERSFGRAAKRLRVAQPSLSQQIRRLEQELGAELVDRNRRPIELTAAGGVFYERARFAVEQAESAVADGRRAARGELGHISIGSTFWAYYSIVPALARAFRARAPGVRLDISTAPPTSQVDGLHKGRLDVLFLAFAQWLMGRRAIHVEPLLEEPMVAIVAEDHRFAEREQISLADIASQPLVALAHDIVPGLIDRQMATFHKRGLYPIQVQEAPDPFAMFSLIGAGVGVGMHMASFSNMAHPGVAFIPVEGDPLTATLLMLWRRDDDREFLRVFLDTARECAHALDPPAVLGRSATRNSS